MSLRVYEGLGGFFVGRAPWNPVSATLHATLADAEAERAALSDAEDEQAWDYLRRLHAAPTPPGGDDGRS